MASPLAMTVGSASLGKPICSGRAADISVSSWEKIKGEKTARTGQNGVAGND